MFWFTGSQFHSHKRNHVLPCANPFMHTRMHARIFICMCRSKDYLRRLQEGSGNVDESGNFSIQVLRAALQGQYDLGLPNISQQGVLDGKDVTDVDGFICHRSAHWFAIRKLNDRYWNLNSTLDQPQVISHFRLAIELESLQAQGYSVFCVTEKLPNGEGQRKDGRNEFWWKEADLLTGKGGSNNGGGKINADPWKDAGSGRRLDGKGRGQKKSSNGSSVVDLTGENATGMQYIVDDDDDDADLAMAIAMSQNEADRSIPVPDEPAAGTEGAVRIQFRLPDGKREIRRFLETDKVAVIYSYVQSQSSGVGLLELRCGFPPKELSAQKDKTIAEAKLAGENIQGRYTL